MKQEFDKEYTINDFNQPAINAEKIVAKGRTYNEINYSSILTKLIQECGRLCERYASDLFIDWRSIEDRLKDGTMETSTYLFGIREHGVDHTAFVLARYNDNGWYARYEYRKIYRLDVVVEKDTTIRMRLKEIAKP